MRGVFIGVAVGLVLAIVASGAGAIAYASNKSTKLRKGWNLKPVVVVSKAVRRGDPIAGVLIAGQQPEQFVTASLLTPEMIPAMQGRTFAVDLPENAPVRVADLEAKPPNPIRACVEDRRPR